MGFYYATRGSLNMYLTLRDSIEKAGGSPDWLNTIEKLEQTSVVDLIEQLGPNNVIFAYKNAQKNKEEKEND